MPSKDVKIALVFFAYILVIILLAYGGGKFIHEHGMLYGTVIGAILCTILWFTVGKTYANKAHIFEGHSHHRHQRGF